MYTLNKTVFHGSNCEVKRGDFSKSRDDIDFGVGFYTTEDERMAKKWACSRVVSVLNEYSINMKGLSVYTFGLDEEWLLYIKANRNQDEGSDEIIDKYSSYDILIGPTADDKMFDTIQLYLDGYITADQAVKYLNIAGYSEQIVLKTEAALDACRFVSSKIIEKGEKVRFKQMAKDDRLEANRKLDELMKKEEKITRRNNGFKKD